MHLFYRSNNFWKAPLGEHVTDLRHSLFYPPIIS